MVAGAFAVNTSNRSCHHVERQSVDMAHGFKEGFFGYGEFVANNRWALARSQSNKAHYVARQSGHMGYGPGKSMHSASSCT